jgi:hypothetical protein
MATLLSLELTSGLNKLVLHNTKLERLTREQYSSLLGLFVNYKGNEMLRM